MQEVQQPSELQDTACNAGGKLISYGEYLWRIAQWQPHSVFPEPGQRFLLG